MKEEKLYKKLDEQMDIDVSFNGINSNINYPKDSKKSNVSLKKGLLIGSCTLIALMVYPIINIINSSPSENPFDSEIVDNSTIDSESSLINTTKVSKLLKDVKNPVDAKTYFTTVDDKERAYLNSLSLFSSKFNEQYYEMYNDNSKNFSISPISLYMALAMASRCANNQTQKELLDAFGVSYNDLNKYIKLLCERTNRISYDTDYHNEKFIKSMSKLTNSLWLNEWLTFNDQCLQDLANNYYCFPYQTDFLYHNAQANNDLNDFVKENTFGKLEAPYLDETTQFAIVNTYYLKDVYNDDGIDLNFTKKEYNFNNSDGTTTKSKLLMGYYFDGRKYVSEKYSHFYLNTNCGYKISFIVPNDGYSLSDVFKANNINEINLLNEATDYNFKDEINYIRYHTRCLFPEFSAECNEELSSLLYEGFGIKDLFTSRCDFSNLYEDNDVYCNAIIHKTKLDVTKKGVEGAAVTVMQMATSVAPQPDPYIDLYEDFVVDKPFGYIISNYHDVQLFSGVVNKI